MDLDILFDSPIFSSRSLVPRGRTRTARGRTVAEYTQLWRWTAVLGGTELPPGSSQAQVLEVWQRCPAAEPRLRTGIGFDVLDVPHAAGFRALERMERMGVAPGPVIGTPGRALFLVAPGTAASLPDLLYRTGWDDAALDLGCHGAGGSVPAPPTTAARWLRPPTAENASRPPEARLLLGALAYACQRGVPELVGRR